MIKGICVALLTPLNEDETIDRNSLANLIEWVLSSRINGIFVAGTIGEGAALRDKQRYLLYKEAVQLVNKKIPVLANVSDTSTQRCLDHVAMAMEAGVDAVVTTARMSFPRRREQETLDHVRMIASYSTVPVWFYEIPATAPCSHSFDEIERILSLPNVAGLKFSSQDTSLFLRCVRDLSEGTCVMTGNTGDIALAGFEGAFGVISGIGSLFPGLCVRTFDAACAGNREEAEMLQQAIASSYRIYGGEGWPFWPAAQKHALVRRGVIRTSRTCAPFCQLLDQDKEWINSELDQLPEELFTHG